MPDIIDFESKKDRRIEAEIEADQAHWESVQYQLALTMEASGLSQSSMVSAALSAVFETLDTDTYNNMSRHDAKAFIARSLKAFGILTGSE
jgi:hypothetical protein